MCRGLAHVLSLSMACFVRLCLLAAPAVAPVALLVASDLYLVPGLVLRQSPVGIVLCPGSVGRLLARFVLPSVTDTPSADYDGTRMMRLRRSDDGMTQEHKDRDED